MSITTGFSKDPQGKPNIPAVAGLLSYPAVTTLAINGLDGAVGNCGAVCSNVVISCLRHYIPSESVSCYIVVIATFVTVIDMLLKAFQPGLTVLSGFLCL